MSFLKNLQNPCEMWEHFLQENEHEDLLNGRIPIQGLFSYLISMRLQNYKTFWEKLIFRTGMFIRKIVRNRFKKSKKISAELHRTAHFLLGNLMACIGYPDWSVDGPSGKYFSTALAMLAKRTDLYTTRFQTKMVATTRKANGLWLVALHGSACITHRMGLPDNLSARNEAILYAKEVNRSYGQSTDRHAHVIHMCPWASNYCRCRPLQGAPIKRRTRAASYWGGIAEQHFRNLLEYLLTYPWNLCLKSDVRQSSSHIIQVRYYNMWYMLYVDQNVEVRHRDPGSLWPSSVQVDNPDWRPTAPTGGKGAKFDPTNIALVIG